MKNETVKNLLQKFEITPLVKKLRDDLLLVKRELCIERALLVTQSYQQTEGEPIIIRRAKGLAKVLDNMTVNIYEGELIVGNQASNRRYGILFPDMAWKWIDGEIDTFATRAEYFLVSNEKKKNIRKILPYWRGKSVQDHIYGQLTNELKATIQAYVFDVGLHLSKGAGHFLLDYEKLLKSGFNGINAEVESKIDELNLAADPAAIHKYNFLVAVKIVCSAAIRFAQRYAVLARDLAAKEGNARRRQELTEIAKICERVPAKPARNFREALQSFWFVQLIPHIDNDGTAISPGRFDQYMYPFYKNDLEAECITPAQAQELVDCLWIKFNEIVQIWPEEDTKSFGGFPISQNLIVGGLNEEGEDVTNHLSFMCLEATRRLRLPQPALSARLHLNSPYGFIKRVVETIKVGTGMPAVYNDEVIISAMQNRGITLKDARNYAIVGCVEPHAVGKVCTWANAAYFNLGKCLELGLNDGVCRLTGKQIGPKTGKLKDFKTFDEVQQAVENQICYWVDKMIATFNVIEQVHRQYAPLPFKSSLTDDCIARGQDVLNGGAIYNFIGVQGVGIANIANGLAAVKKFAFQERKVNLKELQEVLDSNFEDKESLRQLLVNRVPKYGNDDDYVDKLAKRVGQVYCHAVEQYKNSRGGFYHPGLYPNAANVPLGAKVGATPDGRKSGNPLAEGISPSQGTDKKGPTAVFKSAAKIDHFLASNGTLLNMKFNPILLQDERGLEKFSSLIRGYFQLKAQHVQFNIIDATTLHNAQKHPEKYTSLVVRVAGYSAFFNDLNKEIQDDIISRTEHIQLA